MSWEENKEFNESKPQYQPDPPEPYSLWKKTWKYVVVGVVCFLFGLSITTCRANSIAERNRDLSAENRELKKTIENTPAETVLVKVPVIVTESVKDTKKDAAPVTDVPAAKPTENTYDNNEYYDIVETATYKSSSNYTSIVHKVLAKKNVSLTGTILAYGEDGSVIGKSSDDIELTAGQTNFLHYSFDKDISNATLKMNAQANDPGLVGARNAVEMEQYNQSDDELYITFKQTADKLGPFAKFKLLFYKDDKIIATESGYFSIYAKNLNGIGTTDVAEIWVYDTDYDRFEYIFEP